MNVCIVGGGNIAHALVAIIGKNPKFNVSVLSNSMLKSESITGFIQNNKKIVGKISNISNCPKELIPSSDIILITVPSFAHEEALFKIKPYISDNCIIGALPGIGGFNEIAERVFYNYEYRLFSSQRVPCVARIIENGKSVNINLNEKIYIATNDTSIKETLENIFKIKIKFLDSFSEVNLSNSNPILHSARMFNIIKKHPDITKKGIDKHLMFYETWDDESSKTLIQMDIEFMNLVKKLNLKNIKSLYEHYGVSDYHEMTLKIRSIDAFKGITLPMVKNNNKYFIDLKSRYLIEDVDIGMKYILDKMKEKKIKSPNIENVFKRLAGLRK